MRMIPDVRLVSGIEGWDARAALAVNSGVTVEKTADWAGLSAPDYSIFTGVGLYVPKDDWRALDDEELDALIGFTDGDNFAQTIQIFEIPIAAHRTQADRIARIIEGDGLSKDAHGNLVLPAEETAGIEAMVEDWIRGEICDPGGWHASGMLKVVAREPGRLSSTKWEGLHLDIWGPSLSDEMNQGYNGSRFVVNVGSERRRFVFQTIRLETMARMFPELLDGLADQQVQGILHREYWQRLIGDKFIERWPSYPVISVILEPGQGILAPTTCVFHDGLLMGMSGPDITVRAAHSGWRDGDGIWRAPDFLEKWRRSCEDSIEAWRSPAVDLISL